MANYRSDTRDILQNCNCDCNTPPPMPPFPAPVMPASIFEDMMYRVAYAGGYMGTKAEFRDDLGKALNGAENASGAIVQKDSADLFPDIGNENTIYIDMSKRELYVWQTDGYYKIGIEGEGDGTAIPPDGLIYEGGVL